MTVADTPAVPQTTTNGKPTTNGHNKNNNNYEIIPVTQSDALEIAHLEAQAFLTHASSLLMFGPPSPEKQEFRAGQLRTSLAEAGPNGLSVKIVMDGKMVAFAHWTFQDDEDWLEKAREKEERKEREKKENGDDGKSDVAPGLNVELSKMFFGWIEEVRKRKMGGMRYALLHLLITHPDYQGRGLGSALMKHGLAIADEKNLAAWLEASPAGYPLYRKFGFYDIEARHIDLKPFGGEGRSDIFGMFRRNLDNSVRPNDG